MTDDTSRTSESTYRQLVEFASDIIYCTDRKGRFTYCNQMALSLLGYSESEVLGRSYLDLVHPDFQREAARFYGRQFVRRKHHSYYEFVCLSRSGAEFWLGQNVQLVVDKKELGGFQAIARDITIRKTLEDKLTYEASHDPLTGIPNRRYFLDRMHSLMDEARRQAPPLPFSVCICDVDRFKQINDEFGHAAGDDVLRSLSECLRQNMRWSDVVGRLAGDEFGMLLPGTTESQAVFCIERIRERVETMAFTADDRVYSFTASFGVAQVTNNMSPEDLLAAADFALYAAKKAGRNRTAVPSLLLP